MGRRDHFDDGHGMDHHRAIGKVARLAIGASMGAGAFGGVGGAVAGAALSHVADKVYDHYTGNDYEDDEDV